MLRRMCALVSEVIYDAEVTDVKLRHRRKRVFEIIFILGFEIVLLIFLFSFLGWYSIPLYLVGALLFFPSPYIRIPDKYKVTKNGLIYTGEKVIRLKKKYKLRMNEKDEFVSVCSSLGQEFLRLYTPKPDRLYQLLNGLITNIPE